jgi:hypothetical protein
MKTLIDNIIKNYIEFTKLEAVNFEKSQINLEIESNYYLDSRIIKDIKKTIKFANKYVFNFCDTNITLIIAKGDNLENLLIYYTCFLIYLFSKTYKLTTLHIKLICYEHDRLLPDSGDILPYHVNGGVTSYNYTDASIIVYRKQEIIKVLTHEMIHAFCLDAKNIPSHEEMFLNNYFKIRCKSITINESFTDSLACLINTIMFSYFEDSSMKSFQKNFNKEKNHIIEKATLILKYYGYHKINNKLEIKHHICEHTHTISYYVLKALIFTYIHDFANLLENNKMTINVPEYIKLIHAKLDIFIKNLKFNKNNSKNIRMTCLDISENYIRLISNRYISKNKDGQKNFAKDRN